MRLRIISSKEEIGKVDPAEELVHLTFRPSNTDVVALIKACPDLLVVHIPDSYKKTMSKSATMFLSANSIKLLVGDLQAGRNSRLSPDLINHIVDINSERLNI